jgi:peptidoglycan/xylan/chitin deacetylase (PgdA/CDA1 family)
MRFFLFLLMLLFTVAPAAAAKRMALSFDDVPRAPGAFMTSDERTRRLIAALDRAGVEQAAFFVTTGNLDRPHGAGGEARIAAYVEAGHVIGNHSHSHWWLHRTAAEPYVADLDRAAAWLRGRPGYRPWFRFPFLDEGRQERERREAVREALRERGLSNGYVTIDTYDWYLETLARDAVAAGQAVDREALRDLYVESLVELAEFNEQRAVETLGRSPAHVMLLHETDLAALFVADLVAALRARGWEIVTADEAYRDPIAAIEPDTPFLGSGRIAAIAHARGRPARELVSPWTDEERLSRLFAERVLHSAPAAAHGTE